MQSVELFLEHRVEQDVTNWEPFERIWSAYIEFCNEEELPAAAKEGLGRALNSQLDFQVRSSRRIPEDGDQQKRGYVGLRLR